MISRSLKVVSKNLTRLSIPSLSVILAIIGCGAYAGSAHAYYSNYGAIAVGDRGGLGYSWDNPTAIDAYNTAMMNCNSVDYGCEVLTQFIDGCGAIAFNGRRWHGGYGPTLYAAEDDAIEYTSDRIIKWVCD